MKNIQELAYELYKVDWKQSHMITPEREKDTLKDYFEGLVDSDGSYSYEDYIEEFGYNGSLYVRFEEFLGAEYLDKEYMRSLLFNDKLFAMYEKDIEGFFRAEEIPDIKTPIFFVNENYKGLAEHNFIGTKEEIENELFIKPEDKFEFPFHTDGWVDFGHRPDITYSICKVTSAEHLSYLLDGAGNSDLDELIENNGPENYEDWYWSNDPDRCGKNALEIAKQYALACNDINIKFNILTKLGFDISAKREGEHTIVMTAEEKVKQANHKYINASIPLSDITFENEKPKLDNMISNAETKVEKGKPSVDSAKVR